MLPASLPELGNKESAIPFPRGLVLQVQQLASAQQPVFEVVYHFDVLVHDD